MNKPKISYIFDEKDPKRFTNTQRIRNYRYLNQFPSQIFHNCLLTRRNVKDIKCLKKLDATNCGLITNQLIHVLKNINSLRFIDNFKDNPSYLIARCKNVTKLIANNQTESLLTENSYNWLRALTKLSQLSINYPNDIKKIENLLKKRNFEKVHFNFRSAGIEKGWKSVNLLDSKNLSLCIKHARDQGLPLFSPETLSKVRNLDFIVVDGSYPTQEMTEYLHNLLENTTNVKSLRIQKCKLSLNDFVQTITENLKKENKLMRFDYYGDIYGPKLENFNCSMFSKDHLQALKLLITDQDLDSYLVGKFLRQIKQLVNLEDLDLRFACLPYADQIVHDLPCNLPSLKKVTLKFGYNGISIKGDIELRLHLNTFLDWIVSLPNLEEIYLAHPSINYCYCSYLEDYTVSPKLRVVEIVETEDIYDLSLLEVEYLEHDLTTILKILSTESLERFIFPIHLESFKQHMVDVVIQNMMRCVNLKEIRLVWWFNLIGPKITKKIMALFASLHYVKEKEFIVEYCKMTGLGKDETEVQDLISDNFGKLKFTKFENCHQVENDLGVSSDICDLLLPNENFSK